MTAQVRPVTYEITNADGDIVGEVARTLRGTGMDFAGDDPDGPLVRWTASVAYAERSSIPGDLRTLAYVAPRHFGHDERGLLDAAMWVRGAWEHRRRFVASTVAAAAELSGLGR